MVIFRPEMKYADFALLKRSPVCAICPICGQNVAVEKTTLKGFTILQQDICSGVLSHMKYIFMFSNYISCLSIKVYDSLKIVVV